MSDSVRAALAELVALKRLKFLIEEAKHPDGLVGMSMAKWEDMRADYARRKPLAWAAAEAALSAPPQTTHAEGCWAWGPPLQVAPDEAKRLANKIYRCSQERPETLAALHAAIDALAASPQAPQADIMRQLQDPTLVHVAMIRGEIATPDIRTFLHAHGEDALAQWDRGAQAPQVAPKHSLACLGVGGGNNDDDCICGAAAPIGAPPQAEPNPPAPGAHPPA